MTHASTSLALDASTAQQPRRRRRGASKAIPRSDGRGYRAAYKDALGARRWVSAPTADEAEARRDRLVEHIAAGRDPLPPGVALRGLFDIWLVEVPPGGRTRRKRSGIAHKTWVSYEGHVRNHLKPALGDLEPHDITTRRVQSFLDAMTADGRWSARTVELAWVTLKACVTWAVAAGHVRSEVLAAVQAAIPPAVTRTRDVPEFSIFRTRRLLAAVREHRLGSLFEVAATIGPRQGEALAARWEDLDVEQGTLRLGWTLDWVDGAPERKLNKGERGRKIRLPRPCVEALEAWRQRQAEERAKELESGGFWPNDTPGWNLIWTSPYGNPVRGTGTGGATSQLQRRLRDAGFEDWEAWNFYVLRHHAASWLLAANGGNLFEVQRVLGHESYKQLEKTYGHLVAELTAATMAQAQRLLKLDPSPHSEITMPRAIDGLDLIGE